MNAKQAIVVLAAVLAAVCILPSVDGAANIGFSDNNVEIDSMNGGSYTFTVDSASINFELTVDITYNNEVIDTQSFTVQAGDTNTITVDLGEVASLGTGEYSIRLAMSTDPDGQLNGSGINLTVTVNQNILSNWAIYAAIAVVVIVIVIFAYIRMRDTPKKKPEMTFEELEAQRKAEMAQRSEKKQKKLIGSSQPSTQRKRYDSGKEKAEKPKKEKEPKPTFEELEAQRQAEKAAKAEKKSTGLTERERYLEEKRKKKEQE